MFGCRRSVNGSEGARRHWLACACGTPFNMRPMLPLWSGSATPTRSRRPLPASVNHCLMTRSPRSALCSIQTLPPPNGRTPVQYIEVEKKFALPNPGALKSKLDQLGAKQSEPTRQVDAYYNAPHRDFLAPQAI